MALPFFSRPRFSPIGLEFRDRTIVAAQFRQVGAEYLLSAVARAPCPELTTGAHLSAAIRQLMRAAPFRGRRAITSMPRLKVDIRPVLLPSKADPASPAAYREALEKAAANLLPRGLDGTVLDSLPIGPAEINGKKHFRALLIAAQRPDVNAHLQAVTEAGLQCIGLDAVPCAAARILGRHCNDVVAILELDRESSILYVLAEHNPVFSRTLRWGIDALTNALRSDLGISRQEAAGLLVRHGFAPEEAPPGPSPSDDLLPAGKLCAVVNEICFAGLRQLVTQVERSVRYFVGNNFDYTVQRLMLRGQLLPHGLDGLLGDALGLPVTVGAWPGRHFLPDGMAVPADLYMNAAGLALRRETE